MSGMALKSLSAEELAQTPTLFAGFMGYAGTSYKTFGQLRAIYRERSQALHAAEDEADDLRVDRFIGAAAVGPGQTGRASAPLGAAGATRSVFPLSASRFISIARRAPWESSIALSATSRLTSGVVSTRRPLRTVWARSSFGNPFSMT